MWSVEGKRVFNSYKQRGAEEEGEIKKVHNRNLFRACTVQLRHLIQRQVAHNLTKQNSFESHKWILHVNMKAPSKG